MQRLFAGTPWDRPTTCDRCGCPETECACPPPAAEPKRIPPGEQTARLRVEKRPKGKVVTVVLGLDPLGNDLHDLAARLKAACGTGGTVKQEPAGDNASRIEVQGDHLDRLQRALEALGFRTKRG